MSYRQQSQFSLEYCVFPPRKKKCVTSIWKKITKGQFLVFKPACCEHYSHTECFKTWASTSYTESTVRFAYIVEHYVNTKNLARFCIQEHSKKLNCTNCCHTKVHSKYTTDLTALLSLVTYDHSLEYGQLTDCTRLWVQV